MFRKNNVQEKQANINHHERRTIEEKMGDLEESGNFPTTEECEYLDEMMIIMLTIVKVG